MSTVVLPSFVGLGFDVVRAPVWGTTVQAAISGKETRVAKQSYPRWKWDLTYNVLRSGVAYGELQQLVGFFNARQGQFDTFLYSDADDNSVTAQAISTGDGVTTAFQLVRAFGGFIEPVLAPNVVSNVYLNGSFEFRVGKHDCHTRKAGIQRFLSAMRDERLDDTPLSFPSCSRGSQGKLASGMTSSLTHSKLERAI